MAKNLFFERHRGPLGRLMERIHDLRYSDDRIPATEQFKMAKEAHEDFCTSLKAAMEGSSACADAYIREYAGDLWDSEYGGQPAFLPAVDGMLQPEAPMLVTGLPKDAVRYLTANDIEGLLQPGFEWDTRAEIHYFSKPSSARFRMGVGTDEAVTDDIVLPTGRMLLESDWRPRIHQKLDRHWRDVSYSLHTGEMRTALQYLRDDFAELISEACVEPPASHGIGKDMA